MSDEPFVLKRRTPDDTTIYWSTKMAEWMVEKKNLEQQLAALTARNGELVDMLKEWIKHEIDFEASGDAGSWDVEKVPLVIKTRALLRSNQQSDKASGEAKGEGK